MFSIGVGTRRLVRNGPAWEPASDVQLVRLVERYPAAPLALVDPSPVLDVDWSAEPWVWLHCFEALGALGYRARPIAWPELPELPELPPRAIA
jgi:hypothetical protein